MALRLFKNKKAQVIFVVIMVSIMIFILAVVLTQPLKEEIIKAGNTTSLNCTAINNTSYTTATCIIIDMGLFYFISTLIAVGLAYVSGKRNITGIMTAIMVFVVVVVLITPLKNLIVLARNATHLDCASTAISVGARLTCIVVDLWLFYFVAVCIASAITLIFMKKVMPKIKGEG